MADLWKAGAKQRGRVMLLQIPMPYMSSSKKR